ncbi:putative transcriptional regulator [Mycobacteroides abscessus subsp. massiliense]|uniref:helix-turn-helix domain-containing protein n=1 Tax=Mycobacteroides abscessus TaxID=36809 RepID=UPI0009A5A66C|nr:helix-turn-helix transcriptional regulator [Mycobacteroides abscessus]SKF35130.1 putative transcriptional regulator [Mycobacteroides abscessus subsp. massiliense]SKF44202.1 putative transcriptional regulator [Mycobacteroides abscessus subsp. massiliense]SKF45972.1 putative transcriptional regulator [Mycobacteroides abscessus subsp. massiliense]SKF49064.1 putative transcriptional regulator [Mycobacteroides abscessus subsp. massiliense]SKF49424.1 putative transcriptional regulator [Mycobacter
MPKQVVEIDEPALLAILGKNITSARERRNLTIVALAEAAGVDRIFLGRIERGERNPTVMFLTRVAAALNTTPAALLRGLDPR